METGPTPLQAPKISLPGPIALLLISLLLLGSALSNAQLGTRPSNDALEIAAWIGLFIAGVAGVSWVRCVHTAYALYVAQKRQRDILRELADADAQATGAAAERDAASLRKRLQADSKLLTMIETKVSRNQRALRLNHRVQVIALIVAGLLLGLARLL